MRYFVKTFGCQMNKHDSERISGLLSSLGYEEVDGLENADLIIINTCAVREHAVERLRGYVRSMGNARRRGALIAIAGCVSQTEKENLFKELPFVNIIFSPDKIENLPKLIEEAVKEKHVISIGENPEKFASSLPSLREKKYKAWVAITKGCDNFCSYCIVPYVRGREHSRPFESIITEVKRLKAEGVTEVTLLGQNVNSYGRDIYEKPRFSELLEAVAETGISYVRFATSHPKDFDRSIVSVMKDYPNICPHIHLPVQSGSDRILKLMNRNYTRKEYLEKIEIIRSELENAAISTDIIVGFPTETHKDFEDTIGLVREALFDQTFTFIFSPRPFTKASEMKEQVPAEVKAKRFERLVEETKRTALLRNQKMIDTYQEVLVDGRARKGNYYSGRTSTNKVVNFIAGWCEEGTVVDVLIVAAGPYHLIGEVVEELPVARERD